MKRTMKERLLALLCVIVMVCGMWYVTEPKTVEASAEEITTLEGLLEEGYTPWTFSDVGIEDQTVTGDLNKTTASESSLDKTIFHGKILFPAGSGADFGHFYIGGSYNDADSKWTGIRITGYAATALNIQITNESGTVLASNNIWQQSTYNNLRGNEELQLAISVEYLDVTTDGLASIRLGVFVDGVLHLGQYYTYNNVPVQCLTKHVKWLSPSNNPVVKSDSLIDVTLENAPEREYEEWTFSDLGIASQTLTDNTLKSTDYRNDVSLDGTIFNGKINFSDGTDGDFGRFMLGYSSDNSASTYQGFRFEAEGTDKIRFGYQVGTNSYFYTSSGCTNTGAMNDTSSFVLDSATAGTTLRSNPDLQVSLSVKFLDINETDNTVTLKVGLFFDGKLYDNAYFYFKDVPNVGLKQGIYFNPTSTKNVVSSHYINEIRLEDTDEYSFSRWTFADMGIINHASFTGGVNQNYTTKLSTSLDQTIFNAKVNFSDTTNSIGCLFIGGNGSSGWRGFRFDADGTTGLTLSFQGTDGKFHNEEGVTTSDSVIALMKFNPYTAGTTLRGNKDLQVSVSVEYSDVTDTTATVKVGVFFDGVLYDNSYCTLKNVPLENLYQHARWSNVSVANGIYSDYLSDIRLVNAPENDFTYWTFRDVNWSDRSVAENWGWATPSNSTELKNTIFNGKINFPTESTDFRLYIGGATTGDTSSYRGFFFRGNSGDGKLNLSFQGTDEKWYTETGAYASSESGAGPFLTMDSTTAGVDLRGNADLQVSLSIEYGDADENGLVDVKVGVFFDGVLYNNECCTLPDIDPAYLTQNVRWLNGSSTTFSFKSLDKATNVAAQANGASAFSSHTQIGAENTGYGTATLIDGIAGQNDPHYKGATGEDLLHEAISVDIELDDAYSVDHVRMYNYIKEGGFPTDFTIQALTAEGWKTVKTVNDYVAQRGWNDFHFDDTSCTAVRVETISNGATAEGYGFRLAELQVYGVPTLDEVENAYTQAREGVVLIAGNGEAVANDGVFVGVHGHKVQTDTARIEALFQTTVDVQSVQIHAQKPGEFASDIQIYVFNGSAWEQVYSNTNYQYGTKQTVHQFDLENAMTCTAVMVVATGLDELQIQEVRVHGPRSEEESVIFGDIDADGKIAEDVEFDNLQQVLVDAKSTSVHTDWNMDEVTDVCDLVRMKRYFPLSEGIVRTYELSCMTWNVLGVTQDGMQDQKTRAPYIAQEIIAQDKDFVGIQEAGGLTYDWATELDAYLCENGPYQSLKISDSSLYRSDCAYYVTNEKLAPQSGLIIYYKADRFTLDDWGSHKYTVGQTYNGENIERWFHYGKFRDNASGELVYMTNTHWSANLNDAGEEDFETGATYHATQSRELLTKWQNWIGDNLMFATGDFNAYSDTEALKYMNSDARYQEVNVVLGTLGSLKEHIDHIFVNANLMDVKNFNSTLPTFELDGTTYACSDHAFYTTEITYRK